MCVRFLCGAREFAASKGLGDVAAASLAAKNTDIKAGLVQAGAGAGGKAAELQVPVVGIEPTGNSDSSSDDGVVE